MKKDLKVIMIILIIIMLILVAAVSLHYIQKQEKNIENLESDNYENITSIKSNNYNIPENMKVKLKAVVLKVDEKSLLVMEIKNNSLDYVSFAKEGDIGFKEGQEILVYFDGIILSSYPGQITEVGKIEILKEESDVEIPEEVLRYCYSSYNNIKIELTKLTKDGITLEITDTNELKYIYADTYKFEKQVENENYTGVGYKTEATETSTSAYIAPSPKYVFKDLEKISDIDTKDTVETNKLSDECIEKRIDWTPVYGNLEPGKYEFKLTNGSDSTDIFLLFTIDENGDIVYDEPTLLY